MKRSYSTKALALCFFLFHSLLYSEDTTVWIDVRSKQEYNIDHIKGDHLISYTNIVKEVKTLYPKKDTLIALYCKSGGRAGIALDALKKAGYTNLRNVYTIENARKLRKLHKQ